MNGFLRVHILVLMLLNASYIVADKRDNGGYPSTPKQVLLKMSQARNKKEFLKYCTKITRREGFRKASPSKNPKGIVPSSLEIVEEKKLDEYDLDDLAYPNLAKVVRNARVFKISCEKNGNPCLNYFVFVREEGQWRWDFFLTLKLSFQPLFKNSYRKSGE